MKKERTSRIGNLFRRLFRVRAWLDYDRVKAFFLYFIGGAKKLAETPAPEKVASFNAAVKEFGLSESALNQKQHALLLWSRLMCLVAFLVLIWALHHGVAGHYRAFILSLVAMCVALVLAFRYHFWYFQIKSRKLGCTLDEWFKQGLIGGKK